MLSDSPTFTPFPVAVAPYLNPFPALQPGGLFNTNDSRVLNAAWRGGRLVARTTPRLARAALQHRIFEGVVAPVDMAALRATRAVTQTLLVEGRHRVRLYEPDAAAPAGFEPVEPSLEDAYLVLMRLGELPGVESIDATAPPAEPVAPPGEPAAVLS